MNYIDIILAIPLLWALYRGFTKGFIIEIASLIAIILGVYGSIHFSYFISNRLNIHSSYSHLIAFAITFLLIVIIIFLLAKLLEKSINLIALGFFNKLAGAFFCLLKYAFILSVLLMFFNKCNSKISIISDKTKKESLLYKPVSWLAPTIIPKLNFKEMRGKFETATIKKDSLSSN
jgi:membrane protein required for colicin V production